MTDAAKRRYLRVYHLDLQTEYPEVWFDPTCLSTWLRLLSATDQAWPAPAVLPRAVRRADLTMLTKVGLVTVIDRDRFTMKGYEKERTQRADKARQSVSHRYERSTSVERPYIERSTNELLRDAGAAPSASVVDVTTGDARDLWLDADEAALFTYLANHGAAIRPESGFGRRLVGLIGRRGAQAVMAKAIALAGGGNLSDRQWVFGLEAALEEVPDPKSTDRAAENAKVADRRNRGIWARRIEAFHAGGQWDDAWGEPPAVAS